MTGSCREAGLADPVLEERARSFRVTIHSAQATAPRVDPVDIAILEVLRVATNVGGGATSEIARAGRSDRSTRTRLLRLADVGLVVPLGKNRNDPSARWVLASA
jgi:hypothetical protein